MNTEDQLMKGRPIVRSQRIKHPDREKDPFDEIIEIMEEYDKGCEHKPLKYNADDDLVSCFFLKPVALVHDC